MARHLRRQGGPDAIHANYWLSGLAGHRLKHELSLPLVSTFHTLARVKAETGDPEPRPPGRRRDRGHRLLRRHPRQLRRRGRRSSSSSTAPIPSRIEIVPPGVDHAFFSPGDRRGARAALGLGDHPVLLFVGRIQPLKGLDVAIGALAELSVADPDAVLVVVGGPSGADGGRGDGRRPGPHRPATACATGSASSPPQPHHLLSTYYRAADVCIVPSRSESFGLVALEAAACGTPVVAAAVGGLRTLVDDGVTGFLVDTRDPADYAAAVADAPRRRRPRGQASAEAAADRARGYTWSTTAARLRRLYADLTARSPVSCS